MAALTNAEKQWRFRERKRLRKELAEEAAANVSGRDRKALAEAEAAELKLASMRRELVSRAEVEAQQRDRDAGFLRVMQVLVEQLARDPEVEAMPDAGAGLVARHEASARAAWARLRAETAGETAA